uniref:Uncharacterized protein n=1 Tax=Panthera tigris altaica TaxID=74533 RepID=A0A8C9JP05_PANTA
MKSLRLQASTLVCFLLLIKGLGAAPPGHPEAQPPPLSSEHKEPVAGDAAPGPNDVSAPEVRAARNSEPQDEGELFQGVDPRALAAVLLQALDRPASPPAPGGSQQGPKEEAAEALLTATALNLESPGPERVWRASWGEFQARVPERAPLPPPAPPQFQARMPESGSLPEAHQFGEGVSSPKTHLGEALAPLSKAYQSLGAPFPKARRPESSLLGGPET